MPSPATLLRERVTAIVESEFDPEGISVESDKLPRAAGHQGDHRVACSPEIEAEKPGHANVLGVRVKLQMYMAYAADIDENQAVDPAIIEGWGDRLRRAFGTNNTGTTGDFWYCALTLIEYPDDPTGNKTRLEATISAEGENTAAF